MIELANGNRAWALAAARGEITTRQASDFVANIRWQQQHLDAELAEALAEGDRRQPERVPPHGPPWLAEVDEDPATAAAWAVMSGNGPAAPLAGASLLDELHRVLCRYVVFPSAEAVDAVTLFAAATHAQPAWEHASRLVIKSPQKRCGKTRLQEVLAEVCHRVLKSTNISPAALVRSIGRDDPPTVILDEADTIFARGRGGERSEGAEDLRGLLNSGHSRGWPYVRWDASARRTEECPTFSMAVIGGIGDMPDTIEDRAVIVSMRRRGPGEQVAQYRRRRALGPLHDLRTHLHAWMRSHVEQLEEAEPDLPVQDRAADVWEPLVAVADLAGGHWPERARNACVALTGGPEAGREDDPAARLLADLRDMFDATGADKLPTATILDRLAALDEAPWSAWHRGQPLNARGLSKLLRPYNVTSRTIRVGAETSKGYERGDLTDVWWRYLGAHPSQPSHRHTEAEAPAGDCDGNEDPIRNTIRHSTHQVEDASCDGVTAVTEQRPNPATEAP